MTGRLSWLGGKNSAKTDAQSANRARAHKRSIPQAAAAGEAWEEADRRRFSRTPRFRGR
jgi:hypothetical protein